MTTTNNAISTPPAATSSQGFSSMNQLDSGPAALLYTLANKLIQIYNQLQESYNEMTKAEVSVQQSTIAASAQEQRSTASAEAAGYWCQMGATLASAAVTAVSTFMEGKNNDEINKKLGPQEEQLGKLKALEKMAPTRGANIIVEEEGAAPLRPTPAHTRATRMKDGTFESPGDATLRPHEITAENQEAINTMNTKQYETYRKNLQKQIEAQQREINTTNLTRNHAQTDYQQKTQIATNIVNTAGQGAQALTKTQMGEHQAGQQVASGVTSMASSTADNTRGEINKYDKAADLYASARQGAQTYANT